MKLVEQRPGAPPAAPKAPAPRPPEAKLRAATARLPPVAVLGVDAGYGGLVEAARTVQRAAATIDSDEVHAAATHGTSGASGPLPHLDTLQRAFGRHDLRGVRAHTDGAARAGALAMGARGFTRGDRIAFASAPSLRVAAHEAAHVVQQRGGVTLPGGVGAPGDAHERHADRVADRVAGGASVEKLLDSYASAPATAAERAGAPAIQRMPYEQVATGRYYVVRRNGRLETLYLKTKKKMKADPKPTFTFTQHEDEKGAYSNRMAINLSIDIDDENLILSVAGGPALPQPLPQTAPPTVPKVDHKEDKMILDDAPRPTPAVPKDGKDEKKELAPRPVAPVLPLYGPYAAGATDRFWEGDTPKGTYAERLAGTTPLIEAGFGKLDPAIWADLKAAMAAQKVVAPGKDDKGDDKEVARTRSVALTGEALGKDFVARVVPEPIGRPQVLVENVAPKKVPTKRQPAPAGQAKHPGYVLNLPCYYRKPVANVLANYAAQATKGSNNAMLDRMAAVVAVNDRKKFGAGQNTVETTVAALNTDHGFDYTALGFYWSSSFNIRGAAGSSFAAAKREYDALKDATATKWVDDHYYDNRLYRSQSYLPYGIFREQAAAGATTAGYLTVLAKTCDPVFVHVGDPDAISWTVNNDPNLGVLSRYDQVIAAMKAKGTVPALITGGYNFGAVKDTDDPTTKLIKLGNVLDHSVRRSIATQVPEALYPTEPNLLIKAIDGGDSAVKDLLQKANGKGQLFGKGDAEGTTLRNKLAKTLKKPVSDKDLSTYVDATIETEVPERIVASANESTTALGNLMDQKQTYLSVKNWTAIARTGPNAKTQNAAAKAIGDAMKKLIETKTA